MTDAELMEVAQAYRLRAYAPYSHFKVGAAVLTRAGHVYGGCNIENASYPVACCAERTAIFKAVSEGERDIEALAVVGDGDGRCAPCGVWGRGMSEFQMARILRGNLKGEVREVTLAELLPFAFSESNLG